MTIEITRSELEKLAPKRRMDLILGGDCIVINDPPRARVRMPAGAMTRAQFDALAPNEKAMAARTRQIVDADDPIFNGLEPAPMPPAEGLVPAPSGIGWIRP